MSGVERKMFQLGMAYYAPIRCSELPRYYRENLKAVDVVMIRAAPMDRHGYFSFGPNTSHLAAVCERAKTVIVEVNRNMPYCFGGFENGIRISHVDMIVEGENPPIGQMPSPTPLLPERKCFTIFCQITPHA